MVLFFYLTSRIHEFGFHSNEALRLFPPVPLGSQRQVLPNAAPVNVGSVYAYSCIRQWKPGLIDLFRVIPPGTSVYLPPWVLHRDMRNFTFPDAFWPERWMIAAGQMRYEDTQVPSSSAKTSLPQFNHNEVAFTPFSVGPMNCPGKGLAMMELRMVVVALLQSFEFKLREGWDPKDFEEHFKDYFTAARPELPVSIERRL